MMMDGGLAVLSGGTSLRTRWGVPLPVYAGASGEIPRLGGE